jgi:hypothetical protein
MWIRIFRSCAGSARRFRRHRQESIGLSITASSRPLAWLRMAGPVPLAPGCDPIGDATSLERGLPWTQTYAEQLFCTPPGARTRNQRIKSLDGPAAQYRHQPLRVFRGPESPLGTAGNRWIGDADVMRSVVRTLDAERRLGLTTDLSEEVGHDMPCRPGPA